MATKRLHFFPKYLLIKSEVIAAIKQDAEGLTLETAIVSYEDSKTKSSRHPQMKAKNPISRINPPTAATRAE